MIKRFCSSYFRAVQQFVSGTPEWQETFMKYSSRCTVISAEPGKIKYEFGVTKDVLNTVGYLHGGCMATILGICMANLVFDGRIDEKGKIEQRGVALNNSISYLSPVKNGETIVIEANTLKQGRRIAFLEAKVYRKTDETIVAVGSQILKLCSQQQQKQQS
jgi:acyl-coenzyme A thioesterase 13